MEDPELRRKYKKCKYVAKMWEKDFQRKHGTIPSKYDIHDAPRKIRDAYKMYYNLKRFVLEDTVCETFSEDGFDANLEISQDISNISSVSQSIPLLPEMSQPMNVWGEEVSNKKPAKSVLNEKFETRKTPSRSLNEKFFAGYSFAKRNPRKSLSRTTSLPSKSISSLSWASDACSDVLPDLETILIAKAEQQTNHETLMAPAPKKETAMKMKLDKGWLSRHLSESSLSGFELMETQSSMNSEKFGLSNINAEIFRQWHSSNASTCLSSNEQQSELTGISTGDTLQSFQNERSLSPSIPKQNGIDHSTQSEQTMSKPVENDSDSVVENSEDESPKRRFEIIRRPLKKRKIEVESDEAKVSHMKELPTKLESLEDVQSLDETEKKTAKPKRKSAKTRKKTDVEDETEDESFEIKKQSKVKLDKKRRNGKIDKVENNIKVKTKSTVKKRKNPPRAAKNESEVVKESTVDITPECITFAVDSKKLISLPSVNINELNEAEQVISNYIHNAKYVNESSTIAKKTEKPLLREIPADDNLEAKMASGRLNENFVRINLKKKVFVRGRKTVNYSKYKKTLWKQKKAAALCGPEMDMRGCDGGKLKCFKCGLSGHFAQKCPMKGDLLLPLESAQEDESPFPTLEEAEDMAKGKALAVHSRNLQSLPSQANTMIYKDGGDMSEKENEGDCTEFEEMMIEKNDENLKDAVENQAIEKTLHKTKSYIAHKVPEDFLKKAGLIEEENSTGRPGPIYNLTANGEVMKPTDEVFEALRMFGHSSFRKGQEKAIMRILSGVSTLVTLSTGSGKSLCYQLPAYLYSKKKGCITLVISPLVSLMEDQVHGVPAFLNAQCLHTNQNPSQRNHVLEMINKGCVDVLLVSPEAIVAGERSTGFGSILRSLPPIAFACIDEVHCVSQWSHNFRPSYLMICKVLKTKLGVSTILGLTATATFQTRESIIKHLNISDGINGIICDIPLPDNLHLSVSRDERRDYALVELLRSERFSECHSIIVYCTRRDECERLANYIRTCLQDTIPASANSGKRKRINWCAEPYHAGMPASRRRTVQKAFMQNELRIVVATVAFGMGINKPDIRAVIHYNMPKTFESYVQEVGRAGRDGLPAHCHLFLDSKGSDQNELRRHIFANSIDRHVIRKLLQKVFVPCYCNRNIKKKEFMDEYAKEIETVQMIDWEEDYFCETKKVKKRICPGHEIGIPVGNTVEMLDIPEENISTLLCYLELDGRWSLQTLSNAYIMCKIISYGGSTSIKKAAKECPPLAMAIALEIKKGKFDENANIFEFSVIEIASAIGWNSGIVKYQLKNLEWTTVNGLPKRSTLSVSFYELGFRIQSPGDFTDEELDEALDVLYNRSVDQEKTQLSQLQEVYDGLSSVAYSSYAQCCQKDWSSGSADKLKITIREYFKKDKQPSVELKTTIDKSHDDIIVRDVQSMINMYPENTFTGRSLARIFHGIQSPNFPALMWSRCKYWRAHCKIDFNHIIRLANAVIIEMRK